MFQHTKLSTYDVIIVQKSSNGEGKFTFNGWDNYFHRTLSLNLHYWVEKNYESILRTVSNILHYTNRTRRIENNILETTITPYTGIQSGSLLQA